jgi:hypothetical protein
VGLQRQTANLATTPIKCDTPSHLLHYTFEKFDILNHFLEGCNHPAQCLIPSRTAASINSLIVGLTYLAHNV